ncbi:MAG: relaxase/mobilization nuclease domain-containing protein [Dysosmobacter sp.]
MLVCTHVDREHIHSHCVINSVNFETGKKLHMAKEQIQELMRRNDAICQEMGLPVFEPTAQQARGMSGAEYHTALKGQSWKLRLMNTIDACMKLRRRQGRLRFSDGIRGLRRVLGEWPQVHHLHHTGRHEVPRQQITRRKVLQGGHGV